MSGASGIEWTGLTWNPVTGCDKVSAGCRNCYAGRLAETRLKGLERYREGFFGNVKLHEDELGKMLRRRKVPGGMVFVNSMSDLFHEAVPFEFIDKVFAVMALRPDVVFQVLTKRAERMREFMSRKGIPAESFIEAISLIARILPDATVPESLAIEGSWKLSNVWLGVSVEDQARADERVPVLLETPAAVRFVSYEPGLGAVDFTQVYMIRAGSAMSINALSGERNNWSAVAPFPRKLPGLDWVIVGGESGPGARPFDVAWARKTVVDCRAAGVACFVKQWGSAPFDSGMPMMATIEPGVMRARSTNRLRLKDKKGGDPGEWPEWSRVREWPACAAGAAAARQARQNGTDRT